MIILELKKGKKLQPKERRQNRLFTKNDSQTADVALCASLYSFVYSSQQSLTKKLVLLLSPSF